MIRRWDGGDLQLPPSWSLPQASVAGDPPHHPNRHPPKINPPFLFLFWYCPNKGEQLIKWAWAWACDEDTGPISVAHLLLCEKGMSMHCLTYPFNDPLNSWLKVAFNNNSCRNFMVDVRQLVFSRGWINQTLNQKIVQI